MTFDIKKFITENVSTQHKRVVAKHLRLNEADVKGVKLSPEDKDWFMFHVGETTNQGPWSPEEAIKILTKGLKTDQPGEKPITKKLIAKIRKGM